MGLLSHWNMRKSAFGCGEFLRHFRGTVYPGSMKDYARIGMLVYLAAVTIPLALCDLRERRLPNGMVVPGLALAAIATLVSWVEGGRFSPRGYSRWRGGGSRVLCWVVYRRGRGRRHKTCGADRLGAWLILLATCNCGTCLWLCPRWVMGCSCFGETYRAKERSVGSAPPDRGVDCGWSVDARCVLVNKARWVRLPTVLRLCALFYESCCK